MAKSEEDVLSYALFPQVAEKFFKARDGKAEDDNKVREIFVQDMGN